MNPLCQDAVWQNQQAGQLMCVVTWVPSSNKPFDLAPCYSPGSSVCKLFSLAFCTVTIVITVVVITFVIIVI